MSFTPSQYELALVTQIFAKADPQKLRILTVDAARKVFAGTRLPPVVLSEILSLVDEHNDGVLPQSGLAIAVRLLGWAQNGEQVTKALVSKPGPLPTIEGIQPFFSTPSSSPVLPELTPQDKAQYMRIFQSCNPRNGLITGGQARKVFAKSKLPDDMLGQIWNLADVQKRGLLDSVDFTVGMHLIRALMSGELAIVPSSLPGLYEQAKSEVPVSDTNSSDNSNYAPPSNHTCEQAAELRNSQVQLDALNGLVKTMIAEREALKLDLATKSAELSALRDRLLSANTSAQNKLDTLNQSFNAAQAERNALAETLATRTTELSVLQDQLSSADASNADATVLLNMLRQRVKEQGEELQRTTEDLRRARKDLSVMRIEKEEIGIPIHALRAEIAGLKLQNTRLKSENSHRAFRLPDEGPTDTSESRDFDRVFQIISEQRENLLKNSQPLIKCGICIESYPEDQMIPLESCGHKLCRNCVKNYVGTQLAERCFPVLCPVCKAEGRKKNLGKVASAVAQQIITAQQYKTWEKLEMEEHLVPLTCPRCKRSFSADRQDFTKAEKIPCPFRGCNHVWCKQCQRPVNQSGPKHSCSGESELEALMAEKGWKRCPHCTTLVEKIDKCDEIWCDPSKGGCDNFFDYGTGEKLEEY